MKRAQIWISVIIYTLVAVLALVLILNTGVPILKEMRDRAVFSKVRDIMLDLDRHVSEIANQGEGSQAVVSFEIRNGEMRFENGQVIWELETDSRIISPRSSTTQGNLIVSSNANVKTFETNNYYIMTNNIRDENFTVKINKKGSKNNLVHFNTSEIVDSVIYEDQTMDGDFTFSLNDDAVSMNGTGYIEMIPSGNNTNLGYAKVIAHMKTDFANYDLEFITEGYSDFLIVRVKNFIP